MISSLLPGEANGVFIDVKFMTSLLVGAVGAAATVLRNLDEINQDRSKLRREKLETGKIAELLELIAKVPAGDAGSACRQELELQLVHSLRALDALRDKAARRAQAPNHDLTVWQRLFVLFPPRTPHAGIIHALAYTFMAGGPLAILMMVLFGVSDAGLVGDVMVLVVFGSLAFRAWALAERKWAMEPAQPALAPAPAAHVDPDALASIFMLRKSIGWKMLAAQVCMWTCLFCAVESLEDIFLAGVDASKARHGGQTKAGNGTATPPNSGNQTLKNSALEDAQGDARSGLLLFLASLLGAGVCRAWASAEWRRGSTLPATTFMETVFPRHWPATPKAWLVIAGYVAAIALLSVAIFTSTGERLFNDLIDRVEFAFVWLVVCAACSRFLNFHAYNASHSREAQSPSFSQSLAA